MDLMRMLVLCCSTGRRRLMRLKRIQQMALAVRGDFGGNVTALGDVTLNANIDARLGSVGSGRWWTGRQSCLPWWVVDRWRRNCADGSSRS